MSLSSLSINGQISWKQSLALSPFQPRTQGQDSESFNSNSVDLTVFNDLYATQIELPDSTAAEIDLTDFDNLLGVPVTFTRVLSMLVLVDGGEVVITPGDENPLLWFFRNSESPSLTLGDGESNLFCGNPTGQGYPVTSTAKTLKFTNISAGTVTGPATVTIVIPGGTN